MAALVAPLQSTIYWLVACVPCHEYSRRKRVEKENKAYYAKNMASYDDTMPSQMVYRQPMPGQHNPHWFHDIMAGPIPKTRVKATQKLQDEALRQQAKRDSALGTPRSEQSQQTEKSQKSWPAPNWTREYQRPDEILLGVNKGSSPAIEPIPEDPPEISRPATPVFSDTSSIASNNSSITHHVDRQRTNSIPLTPGFEFPSAPASAKTDYTKIVHTPHINNGMVPVCMPPSLRKNGTAWMRQDLPTPAFMSGKDIRAPEPGWM